MVSLLNGVIQRGTGARATVLHKTLAGKTGTTNKNFDAWFIGFTPYVTVGSYVGYDNPKSMGRNATGATIALPIFVNFMQDAVAGLPDVNFAIPEGVYFKKVYRDTGLVVDEQDVVDQNSATIFEVFRDSGEIPEKKFANEEYMQHQKSLKAAENFIGGIIDSLEE
jgi:penicillin-binding protein 1A